MRIGYPCINLTLECRPSRTFRLASLSEERLRATIAGNLACLEEIVRWNAARGLLFLRITSDLIPFGSHPANRLTWEREFAADFARIGALIRAHGFRISMHPGQYTLLNSPHPPVLAAALADLAYHARVLKALGLDRSAKIQTHVGGVYGDRSAAMARFIAQAGALDPQVRARLVVENDERFYTVADCLTISRATGLPVLFDCFHHELNPGDHTLEAALEQTASTWGPEDGLPMVDYSSPLADGRAGRHAQRLDATHFRRFLEASRPWDFDLMLEVKDKERSALRALEIAAGDPRVQCTGLKRRCWARRHPSAA